jgi:DNA polymerase (family 10)
MLYEIADLLELKGVQFKPRAYRRAAQNIETLSDDIEKVYKENMLQEIEGVGESIATKVREILETGNLEYLQDLKAEFPSGLQEMMNIQGLGPKTLMKLYEELGISNLDELETAAKNKKIRKLEGFGKKSENNILENIELYKKFQERFLLGYILPIAKGIENKLKNLKEVEKINLAGSIRRRKETIGDVDILIVSKKPTEVMDYFTSLEEVERIVSKGETKSTIITGEDLQIDLRVVEESSFGSALQYFTGSKDHNIELRKIALDSNWKLSEYGLVSKDDNKIIARESEEDIYKKLGLKYIEPELRENRGEIKASKKGTLPDLIQLKDIKGDLHVHTKWSEGSHTIKEMAKEAIKFEYDYLAICDHAKTLQIAQGIKDEDFPDYIDEIKRLDDELDEIKIFSGIEANIDSDGNLDVPIKFLKDLDIVVGSVHSGFKMKEKEMTARINKALHNDYINILGHPTGRILKKREPYEVNLTEIFKTAKDMNVFMEINSFPERLDLSDINCQNAKKYKIEFAINTDAHNLDHLRYMELGIATARRGWLEKKDVINSLELSELKNKIQI